MSVLHPELVMGWLVMALVNGELAVTRERDRWRWMGVSALLGPLATVLLLVLSGSSDASTSGGESADGPIDPPAGAPG